MNHRTSLLLAASVFATSCSQRNAPQEAITPQTRVAHNEVVLEQIALDRFEEDRLRYHATLKTVKLDRVSGLARGQNVTIHLFGDTGKPRGHIQAPTARTTINSGVTELKGGVTMTDEQGRILRTDAATYDGNTDQLRTKTKVRLEGKNFRADGASLSGQSESGRLEVKGPVSGRVVPVGSKKIN